MVKTKKKKEKNRWKIRKKKFNPNSIIIQIIWRKKVYEVNQKRHLEG